MNSLRHLAASCAVLAAAILSGSLEAGPVTLDATPAPVAQRSVLEEALAPELAFRYDYDFEMSLQDDVGAYSMQEFRASVPLPPVITDTFILIAGLNYRLFEADVSTHVLDANLDLHTLRLPLQAAWLSPSSPWMIIAYAEPGLSTDFSDVNSDSFDLSVAIGAGYRFSPNFMLALGVGYSRNYGDNDVLPAFALLWRPSDHFLLTASPDGVVPEWRISDDWRLKLRLDLIGGRWTIDEGDSQARVLRLQGASASLLLEHRLFKECWLTVGAGLNTLANLRLEDEDGSQLLDSDLDEALVLRSGLKWKF
jgi:hypothetical protein